MAQTKRKKARTAKSKSIRIKAMKSDQVPATAGMLYAFRSELKSDLTTLQLALTARMDKLNADSTASLTARMDKMNTDLSSRIDGITARMDNMTVQMEKMNASNQRMLAIYEEQNARNKVVMDGYGLLLSKDENLEARVGKLEKKVFGIEAE